MVSSCAEDGNLRELHPKCSRSQLHPKRSLRLLHPKCSFRLLCAGDAKNNEHLNVPPVAQNADNDAHPHINVIGGKHRKYALSAYINDFDAQQFYGQKVTWIFRVVDISKKVPH